LSYLADIRTYLIAQSVGTSTNIVLERMPTTPDACMCLAGTGGLESLRNTDGGEIARPGMTIIVRHQTPETGRAWLESAKTALKAVKNTELSGTKYLEIKAVGGVLPTTWNNLSITLSQNYEIMRAE